MTDDIELVESTVEAAIGTPPVSNALRSAAIYAVGAALPRAIGLLTLPIYTRVLSPEQYGTFSLLVAISSAVAIVLALGLDVAIFRLYFQLASDPERQQRFVNSVWSVLLVVPTAAACLIGAVAWPLMGQARFGGLDLFLALVGSAVSVAALTVPLAVLRAEQRLRTFLVVTSVSTVANVGLSLFFVVGLRWGVRGWLAAAIVANLLTLGTAIVVIPYRRPRPLDRPLLRHALGFGAPLVPHSFAHWALQAADRVVIAGIVSQAALGVYSLASNLGLPVLMLVQSINYGFMPSYARAGAGMESRRRLADVVVLQATVVAFICAGCALLAPPFIDLVTPSSYGHAGALVPWIALGYGFLGLYFIPMNGISLGGGRTKFAAVTSLAGAGTNIGLLYLFVPSGGIHAAAIASAVAYAVLLLAVFVYAWRPENPVRYRWVALAIMFGIVGGDYVLARVVTSDLRGLNSLLIRTALLVAAGPIVLLGRPSSRLRVRRFVRGIVQRMGGAKGAK
jgi:O-antigen/teichoic acid export membrane protein